MTDTTDSEPTLKRDRQPSSRLYRLRPSVAGIGITVVIPAYNEADSVMRLADEIEAVFADSRAGWECLWVDDGSGDETPRRLDELHRRDPEHHHHIRLERRCGQSGALTVGFRFARGSVIATLDADLQNDPAEIPRLVAMLERGRADMVTGVRVRRQDGWLRRVSSRVANGFRNWITRDHIRDVGCSLRVFYREAVDGIPVFTGMHRFLPTLARMNGFTVVEVPVNHRPRRYGATKYGVHNRLWRGIADCLAVRWMQARWISPRVAGTTLAQDDSRRSDVS